MKIITLLVACFAFASVHAQDKMNKKMENKTDKMNKKMENKTDKMNKKIGDTTARMNNRVDSAKSKFNKPRQKSSDASMKKKITALEGRAFPRA